MTSFRFSKSPERRWRCRLELRGMRSTSVVVEVVFVIVVVVLVVEVVVVAAAAAVVVVVVVVIVIVVVVVVAAAIREEYDNYVLKHFLKVNSPGKKIFAPLKRISFTLITLA
ncbi:hypothetical protein ElyMa_005544600 [Elysia marginata]|uniref:Transmembrane protein n=1 Tax=Elysia marginata TaxID=1093978 RepID=A0AAV4EXP1_9GAST|nr:hypothetical protein ElyMa_005544600 [Elysia marginata]